MIYIVFSLIQISNAFVPPSCLILKIFPELCHQNVTFYWIIIFQWKKLSDDEKVIYEEKAKIQNKENAAKYATEQAENEER